MSAKKVATHVKPVLAANWKMNLGPSGAALFAEAFLSRYTPRTDQTVILFPSAFTFSSLRAALHLRPDVTLGAQNIHSAETGAFTGENSAVIVKEAGATFVLVGHSERRHVFGETDEESALKCARAAAHDLVPVLCVGETIKQRDAGETDHVVLRQLRAGLSGLDHPQMLGVIIAYEPVWAIGTGRTATPDDAAQVHAVIRAELSAIIGDEAEDVPILYGGSVTASNAAALLAANEVDGLLVGGASLDPQSWASICLDGRP